MATTGNSSALPGRLAPVWVTGTTYPAGYVVWSPSDYQYYMRKSAGAGATDPSSDTTNWQATGDRAVKSIQRGTIALNTAVSSATATITSVVTGKTELRYLGVKTDGTTPNDGSAHVVLTNSTTVTATKQSTGGNITLSWELTERY